MEVRNRSEHSGEPKTFAPQMRYNAEHVKVALRPSAATARGQQVVTLWLARVPCADPGAVDVL